MKGQAVELSAAAERDAAQSDVAITQSFFFPFVLYLRILDVCVCVSLSTSSSVVMVSLYEMPAATEQYENLYIHSNVSAFAS